MKNSWNAIWMPIELNVYTCWLFLSIGCMWIWTLVTSTRIQVSILFMCISKFGGCVCSSLPYRVLIRSKSYVDLGRGRARHFSVSLPSHALAQTPLECAWHQYLDSTVFTYEQLVDTWYSLWSGTNLGASFQISHWETKVQFIPFENVPALRSFLWVRDRQCKAFFCGILKSRVCYQRSILGSENKKNSFGIYKIYDSICNPKNFNFDWFH